MLRLADLIRQGVVTHPGHAHLGGVAMVYRHHHSLPRAQPVKMEGSLKKKIKKKKKSTPRPPRSGPSAVIQAIARGFNDPFSRAPHGQAKSKLHLDHPATPELLGKDLQKMFETPAGREQFLHRYADSPKTPKQKEQKKDLVRGRRSESDIRRFLVPIVRVVGKKHEHGKKRERDEFL